MRELDSNIGSLRELDMNFGTAGQELWIGSYVGDPAMLIKVEALKGLVFNFQLRRSIIQWRDENVSPIFYIIYIMRSTLWCREMQLRGTLS